MLCYLVSTCFGLKSFFLFFLSVCVVLGEMRENTFFAWEKAIEQQDKRFVRSLPVCVFLLISSLLSFIGGGEDWFHVVVVLLLVMFWLLLFLFDFIVSGIFVFVLLEHFCLFLGCVVVFML